MRLRSLSILASLLPALAAAQAVTDIPNASGCRGCRITVTRIATLGAFDGPGIIESENTGAVVDGRGRYFLFQPYRPWVKVFDARGRYVTTMGREGAGPGEFRGVGMVRIGRGDTIHVFDAELARHSVFAPDLRFVRAHPTELMPQVDGIVLADGRVVIPQLVTTPERVGLPLHLIRDGRVERSFGSESGAFRPDLPELLARSAAPAQDGGIWSAHRYRYRIELWTAAGRKTRELRREVAWFPPHTGNWRPSTTTPPPTLLREVWQDAEGLLWARILVADRDWRRAVSTGGPHGSTITSNDAYRDTLLEVIDPVRGRVLASARLPNTFLHLGRNRVGAVVTNADGVPFFAVWQLDLVTP